MSPAPQYRFESFRLDVDEARLWRGGDEINLRPKTFAVLRHLVTSAGRLVSREQLVHAVWNGAAGSELLAKGCIRELRGALGDEAARPRFIQTVARRGYRFVAPVERIPAVAADGIDGPLPAESRPLLVGRHEPLTALARALGATRQGGGRTIFITGEAGIGKSALLDAFLAEVATFSDTLLAIGHCVEQHGRSEPYLPVLEALGRLGRSPGGAALVTALERHAPTWLLQLPGLLDADPGRLAARAAGANRERMLRELGDALEVLTADSPLVLAIEDLQWCDGATVTLLASLAQRRAALRLLILATCRMADVIGPDHPLRFLHADLRARELCEEIALPFLRPDDVAAYLDARFPRHRFPAEAARALHGVSDGNPLFLVNVVRDLLARRRITAADDGAFELNARPDEIATDRTSRSRSFAPQAIPR